ncbi:hypothetical protein GQ85_21465 [Rhodococcus rhodochrous]|nr:hypothetical protein GQ85_21465 [Rhodococcus rhodochrous]
MTGYDWRRQAERLERENADLRRQTDRAWGIARNIAHAAIARGILLDTDGLGDHWLSLRAIEIHTAARADLLEQFRKATITALHNADDAVSAGADPAQVLESIGKGLRAANDRAKNASMKDARDRAHHELAELDEPALFTIGATA